MIAIDQVLVLVNNLDHRAQLRRFAPQWSIVFVSESLHVLAVERFKYQPDSISIQALTEKYPKCAYFYAHPGMYGTAELLSAKVRSCADAFAVDWSSTSQHRVLVPQGSPREGDA